MTLRRQILAAFAVVAFPIVILAIVAASVVAHLGGAVEAVLAENDRTLDAVAGMERALERTDSAALLVLLGRPAEAAPIAVTARARFRRALAVASGNLTVPGEGPVVEGAGAAFGDVTGAYDALDGAGPELAQETYSTAFVPAFDRARARLGELRDMNRAAAAAAGRSARASARTAAWTVLVGALVGLLLTAWAARKLSAEIAAHVSAGPEDPLQP